MFKSTTLFLFASILTHDLFLGVNGEAANRLALGMYKIVHPTSATLARNFPGAGPRGPWTTSITMTGDVSSNYQMWEILASEEGYRIQNYGSKNSAFSYGHKGDVVTGFSEGFTKWYIEANGGAEYRIHYPNRDLVWTVDYDDDSPNTVSLKPFQGGDNQIFRFDKLQNYD